MEDKYYSVRIFINCGKRVRAGSKKEAADIALREMDLEQIARSTHGGLQVEEQPFLEEAIRVKLNEEHEKRNP